MNPSDVATELASKYDAFMMSKPKEMKASEARKRRWNQRLRTHKSRGDGGGVNRSSSGDPHADSGDDDNPDGIPPAVPTRASARKPLGSVHRQGAYTLCCVPFMAETAGALLLYTAVFLELVVAWRMLLVEEDRGEMFVGIGMLVVLAVPPLVMGAAHASRLVDILDDALPHVRHPYGNIGKQVGVRLVVLVVAPVVTMATAVLGPLLAPMALYVCRIRSPTLVYTVQLLWGVEVVAQALFAAAFVTLVIMGVVKVPGIQMDLTSDTLMYLEAGVPPAVAVALLLARLLATRADNHDMGVMQYWRTALVPCGAFMSDTELAFRMGWIRRLDIGSVDRRASIAALANPVSGHKFQRRSSALPSEPVNPDVERRMLATLAAEANEKGSWQWQCSFCCCRRRHRKHRRHHHTCGRWCGGGAAAASTTAGTTALPANCDVHNYPASQTITISDEMDLAPALTAGIGAINTGRSNLNAVFLHRADSIVNVDVTSMLELIIRHNDRMQVLSVQACDFSSDELIPLLKGLISSKSIDTVQFSNPLCQTLVDGVAQLLAVSESLTSLSLAGCGIAQPDFQPIADVIVERCALRHLTLDDNGVGTYGARALSARLGQPRCRLRTLSLVNTQLTYVAAQCLQDGLRACSSLVSLDLSLNPLQDAGVNFLADALQNNTTLHTISISRVDVTDPAVVTALERVGDSLMRCVLHYEPAVQPFGAFKPRKQRKRQRESRPTSNQVKAFNYKPDRPGRVRNAATNPRPMQSMLTFNAEGIPQILFEEKKEDGGGDALAVTDDHTPRSAGSSVVPEADGLTLEDVDVL